MLFHLIIKEIKTKATKDHITLVTPKKMQSREVHCKSGSISLLINGVKV